MEKGKTKCNLYYRNYCLGKYDKNVKMFVRFIARTNRCLSVWAELVRVANNTQQYNHHIYYSMYNITLTGIQVCSSLTDAKPHTISRSLFSTIQSNPIYTHLYWFAVCIHHASCTKNNEFSTANICVTTLIFFSSVFGRFYLNILVFSIFDEIVLIYFWRHFSSINHWFDIFFRRFEFLSFLEFELDWTVTKFKNSGKIWMKNWFFSVKSQHKKYSSIIFRYFCGFSVILPNQNNIFEKSLKNI